MELLTERFDHYRRHLYSYRLAFLLSVDDPFHAILAKSDRFPFTALFNALCRICSLPLKLFDRLLRKVSTYCKPD